MADKRMFSVNVIDSDMFLDMPLTTQALYFHLAMRADDDGFVGNPKKILRMICASEDDLKVLLSKQFLIPFESGIVVIRHWKIHNYIRKDCYKSTIYTDEARQIQADDTGMYQRVPISNTLSLQDRNGCVTDTLQVRNGTVSQISIDKIREDKISIDKEREREETPTRNRYGLYNNVILTDAELEQLALDYPCDYKNMIENLSVYMKTHGKLYADHYAMICKWAREDQAKQNKNTGSKVAQELDRSYEMYAQWAERS